MNKKSLKQNQFFFPSRASNRYKKFALILPRAFGEGPGVQMTRYAALDFVEKKLPL